MTECSEEYQDFVREMSSLIEMFTRVMVELPLYKLYDNKLSQDFKRGLEVSVQHDCKSMSFDLPSSLQGQWHFLILTKINWLGLSV